MWLFTKNSFVSVVAHRERPNDVMIRARRKGDLSRLFPKEVKRIQETPDADYRFRIIISKKQLAKVIQDYILQFLTYDNFKAAQNKDSEVWTAFLHQVWLAGLNLQPKTDDKSVFGLNPK